MAFISALVRLVGDIFAEKTGVELSRGQVVDWVCGVGLRAPKWLRLEGEVPEWAVKRVEKFLREHGVEEDAEEYFRRALGFALVVLDVEGDNA